MLTKYLIGRFSPFSLFKSDQAMPACQSGLLTWIHVIRSKFFIFYIPVDGIVSTPSIL